LQTAKRSQMWTEHRVAIKNGLIIRLQQNGTALSQQTFFEQLSTQGDFVDWYNSLLADIDLAAYFWEFPAMSARTLASPTEFVIIEAPALVNAQPQPEIFSDYFSAADPHGVAQFPSLGGDALLIAPAPTGESCRFAHLASFVRNADHDQLHALWLQTAQAVLSRLSGTHAATPFWLSTSGLGVSWLHVRLDSRPKYYQHGPYKQYAI
jgi:hypothetical protein